MDKYIEIRFSKSSSVNYPKAVELSRKFSDFQEMNEDFSYHVIKTNAEEIFENQSLFDRFFNLIYSWQSVKIIYNGRIIQKQNFLYPFILPVKCKKDYDISVKKETYCNLTETEEGWGCKFLQVINRHLQPGIYQNPKEYWYCYGNFESENRWKLNKVLIRDLLLKEAENNRVIHCPRFSLENVLNKIDELPDYISIEEGNGWEIVYKDDFVGTTVQKIAIGIKYIDPTHKLELENKSNQSENNFSFLNLIGTRIKDAKDNKKDTERKRFIPETTYDDIGGIDDIIDQIREVIELPLKRPDLYQYLGIKPHKGILLYGDPGNGKTLIAKAIANEVKAHFIPISGSELISKYIGESEENLREVFNEARELQPSIIFFDEIDSVTQNRSSEEINRHEAKFVNQLLTLMDGMEAFDNVAVLASTNRPELIDNALLRPGRFDFKIEIKKPDEVGCLKIFKIATRKMPLDDSLNVNNVTKLLIGCSGAEITFIVKEAGLNALKRNVNIKELISDEDYTHINFENILVTYNDFIKAVDKLRDNTLK